ncbi:MAG: discoidin domain-containing protein [Anaerolineales bacterium]
MRLTSATRLLRVACFSLLLCACATAAPPATPTSPPTAAPIRPTETLAPPTVAPSDTPEPSPSATPQPEFTQEFTVSAEGELFGNAGDLRDGSTDTWASLRGQGNGTWVFDLGSEQLISAVTFWPVRDENDPVIVHQVEVSRDAETWTPVYASPAEFPENEWTTLNFDPVPGRFVRILAGPRWLALAEVQIEVQPLASP